MLQAAPHWGFGCVLHAVLSMGTVGGGGLVGLQMRTMLPGTWYGVYY